MLTFGFVKRASLKQSDTMCRAYVFQGGARWGEGGGGGGGRGGVVGLFICLFVR